MDGGGGDGGGGSAGVGGGGQIAGGYTTPDEDSTDRPGPVAEIRKNTNLLPVGVGGAGIAALFGANAVGLLNNGAFVVAPLLAGLVTVAFLHDEPARWLGTGAAVAATGVVAGVGIGIPAAAAVGAPESEYLDMGTVGLLVSPGILLGGAVVAVVLGKLYAGVAYEDDDEGFPESP